MKRIISVLLCVFILAGSVFNTFTSAESSGYLSAGELLKKELGLGNSQIVYSNSFNDSTVAPVTLHKAYRRSKNQIVDGRWFFSGEIASEVGLSTDVITDFAYSFEFEACQQWSTADFLFHETSGWPGAYDSYLRIRHNEDGSALIPTLVVDGESTQNENCKLKLNTVYKIVLTAKNNKYSLYIWEAGKRSGNAVITFNATTESSGNFHFYSYQANTYVDNIKVYDISLLNIDTDGALLLYSNDFNQPDSVAPMGISGTLSNGGFSVAGSSVTGNALTGMNTLGDFLFSMEYKTANAQEAEEMWHFADNSFAMSLYKGKVYLSGMDTGVALTDETVYSITVCYRKETADLYFWQKGTPSPVVPTASADVGTVTGDIGYSASKADSFWDNIKVYDFSSVESDIGLKKLAEWNFDDSSKPSPIKADSGISYDNKALRFSSGGANLKTENFFGKNVGDFFWQFDYTPKEVANQTDRFVFHCNTANKTSIAVSFLGNSVASGGKNLQICSINSGAVKVLASTEIGELTENQTYTVRILFIGDMVCVKYWKHGYETPEKYNLTVTADTAAFHNGDFRIESNGGNFTVDRMTVYSDIPDMTPYDEEETIVEPINEVKKLCEYHFNDETEKLPFGIDNTGTLSYSKNRLFLQTNWSGKDCWSDAVSPYALKDFAWQFEYATAETMWNVDYFVFHSQGKDTNNRLYLLINGAGVANGGDNVFIIQNESASATTLAAAKIPDLNTGLAHKIRIVMHKNDIQVFIWESGEATPANATLSAVCDTEKLDTGDIYYYGYQSFFYIDDMILYQGIPDRSLLDEKAASEDAKEELLLDTDFSKQSDLLCDAVAPASTSVKDGVFNFDSGGQNMLYGKPIINGAVARDFSWQFDYKPQNTLWNTDKFVFHSDGEDEGAALFVQILGNGNAGDGDNISIVQRISQTYTTLASAKVPLVSDVTYTVRIICRDGQITVYYWMTGTNTPKTPLLSATSEQKAVKKGMFLLQGFQSLYSLDNMRIYNYADGHQLTTSLDGLPKNVTLAKYDFNGMRGKTDFPFEMKDSLLYWQNTLKFLTPAGEAEIGKNIAGDYMLDNLCWDFEVRDFQSWSVNRFVIHSTDGSLDNCIYLMYLGEYTKGLDDPTFGVDPDHCAMRLIQVVNGKQTVIGKYDEELKRGKAYRVRIVSRDNNIEVSFGAKRTGKLNKVISAKASSAVSSGMTFFAGYQMDMWVDNMALSNCPYPTTAMYKGSLKAITK